jgi:hypothetical protein
MDKRVSTASRDQYTLPKSARIEFSGCKKMEARKAKPESRLRPSTDADKRDFRIWLLP